MCQQSNLALYLSNKSDKNYILNEILENRFLNGLFDLSVLKGVLYSSITIDKIIEEELQHDKILIQSEDNKNLRTMSSGQQRKALLNYLLAQNPEFILLDDVYSNIDKLTQQEITGTINKLGNSILLIQILFRKRDLLDSIDTIYFVDNQNNISHYESRETFTEKSRTDESDNLSFVLPQSYSDNLIETELLVELKNINVNYEDKKVLHNLNWTIKKGEFWQLVGPNGSGKSTLVSMISGDNPKAYRQDITLFGRKKGSGESIWDIKSKIGYFTPAMIHQFKRSSTVEEMIISGIVDSVGLYIQPTDIQKDIAYEWMQVLGLKDRKTLFQKISLGQQRMVMVARAMVKHPALLILDEPTIELDDENTSLFIDLIHAIAREKDTAIIYISHRNEDNLKPNKIFELIKTENGYTGFI